MGKSQKQKKRSAKRHNPVRVPDSHLPKGLEAAAASSSRKDAVLPIIQKLESADDKERLWACSAVSNLIQNDPSTRRLLQGKNIVGALITRLSDSVEEVVVEAAGALRNLCIDGGFDICAEMFNKNILAPLTRFIPKISTALHQIITSPKSAPDNATELVYGLAENVITLLWCLSETSNKAFTAINQLQLAPFLISFLENREKLPARTVAAAAQCLYVLTDDNPAVAEELRMSSSYINCLVAVAGGKATSATSLSESKDIAEERLTSIRILASGVLRNISPIPYPSAAAALDIDHSIVLPLVIPVVSSISLSEITSQVLELVTKEGEELKYEKQQLKGTPKSDHKSQYERQLEYIESRLRNVQLSLEILTGLGATLPEPDVQIAENGEDDAIDDDDESTGELDADMEVDQSAAPNSTTIINGDVPQAPSFLQTILPQLLSLIVPTQLSFPPLPSTSAAPEQSTPVHLPTTSALAAVHIAALECLNNAFLTLALSENGPAAMGASKDDGQRIWDAVWSALGIVGVESGRGQDRRKEMWEIAVGVLWGIGSVWRGEIVPNEEHTKLLMQFGDASSDAQIKVKCIGALEALAHYPTSIEANAAISNYLLNIASTAPTSGFSAEPIFQAVSSLVDIYSDESKPYDVNLRQPEVFKRLFDCEANVRKAIKGIDRKKRDGVILRERGAETLQDLRDFIVYRRSLKL